MFCEVYSILSQKPIFSKLVIAEKVILAYTTYMKKNFLYIGLILLATIVILLLARFGAEKKGPVQPASNIFDNISEQNDSTETETKEDTGNNIFPEDLPGDATSSNTVEKIQ